MAFGGSKKKSRRKRRPRRKVCPFCADKFIKLDYKNVGLLERFITERGKIMSSRITGVCSAHQRGLALEIKRARNIALLPYTVLD